MHRCAALRGRGNKKSINIITSSMKMKGPLEVTQEERETASEEERKRGGSSRSAAGRVRGRSEQGSRWRRPGSNPPECDWCVTLPGSRLLVLALAPPSSWTFGYHVSGAARRWRAGWMCGWAVGIKLFYESVGKDMECGNKSFFFPRQVYQVNNYMHGLRSVVAVLSMNIISDIYLKA